jgi:cytochrome c oxidase subunit II
MLEILMKAAHIAFLSLWAAGLIALPALLGRRREADAGEHARRLRFSRLAFQFVVSPAAVLTVATGIGLLFLADYETPWLGAKLAGVSGMALIHMRIGAGLEYQDKRYEPGPAARGLLMAGALVSVSIALGFVLGKPGLPADFFPGWFREGRPEDFLDGLFSGLVHQAAAAGALFSCVRRKLDRETMLENELAAMPARKCDQHDLKAGKQRPPGQHRILEIADPVRPVQPENCEQGHGDDAVAPCGGMAARARDGEHFSESGQGGQASHQECSAGTPQRSASEEGIERPPVGSVTPRDPENPGNGKGDEHGMDRMAENGDPAVQIGNPVRGCPGRSCHIGALRNHGAFLTPAWAAVAAAAVLTGCAGPLSTLDPAGPAAMRIATLWWIMLAGAVLILAGVCLLALLPFLNAGMTGRVSSRIWLWGGGLAFPLVTLFALLIYAFVLSPVEEAARAGAAPVRVQVIARQFYWTFVHLDAPGGPVETQGQMHIPAGRTVELAITSEDVIHSFWVPRLAGKRDAIPGRVNTLTIRADAAGAYGGICNEFCGLGHAGMNFEVIAHDPEHYADILAALAAAQDTGGGPGPGGARGP